MDWKKDSVPPFTTSLEVLKLGHLFKKFSEELDLEKNGTHDGLKNIFEHLYQEDRKFLTLPAKF